MYFRPTTHTTRTCMCRDIVSCGRSCSVLASRGMLICQWGTPFSTPDGVERGILSKQRTADVVNYFCMFNRWSAKAPRAGPKGSQPSFRLSDAIVRGWSHVYRIYNQAIHIAASGVIGPAHIADADFEQAGNQGMTSKAAWAHDFH